MDANECIEWEGPRNQDGYGQFSLRLGPGQRVTVRAHRMAYELLVGPIPVGLVIDHLCRNRACVNPRHMEAVEHRVNSLRGYGAPAQHARRTACAAGHPLTGRTFRGHRECTTCRRARKAKWERDRRAAKRAEVQP